MALQWTSWRADGNGQTAIDSIRSDSPKWVNRSTEWLRAQKANRECVLVTKSRTDSQSHVEHIIWQRPGYTDPCQCLDAR